MQQTRYSLGGRENFRIGRIVLNGQKRNAPFQLRRKDCEQNVVELWQLIRLTLLGKITLIKSLLVSQIINILTSLPTYAEALQKVNKFVFEFLCDGKGDKI